MVNRGSRGKRELTALRAMPNDLLVRDTPNLCLRNHDLRP